MILLDDLPKRLQADDPEERRIVTGVAWEQYEALLNDLGDSLAYRVAYLDGVLEIVSPSRRHERGKTQVGTLLEIYFLETDTEYFPMGSTTLRKPEKRAGGEPDESYCIGTDKEFPDLVIEVVVTSGGINRLDLFRRLGIREVWFWKSDRFSIYHLRETAPVQFTQTFGYELISHSELLPRLDINLLAECLRYPNPLAAGKEFRQRLRE
ncbi:MAG TPA: Uma2 family endonuclease, partial [Coleofasciculaceae cyanobacterium]